MSWEPDSLESIEIADDRERKAGRLLRSAFYALIGEDPKLGPGDVEGAEMRVWQITHAIRRGGWTRNERARLHKKLTAWQRRARGHDPWFLMMGTIDRCLRAAGGRPDQVVKVQVFLTDIAERARINPIRQEYFGEHRPASTLVEVSALVDPRMKVEIEAVAYLGP